MMENGGKIKNGGVNLSKFMSKEQRDLLKQEYPKYFLLVRSIINQLDPLDLIDMGAPEDEHDSLTAKVLVLLVNDKMNEIRQCIIDSYDGYGFGVNKIHPDYRDGFYKEIDETTKQVEDLYKEFKKEGLNNC